MLCDPELPVEPHSLYELVADGVRFVEGVGVRTATRLGRFIPGSIKSMGAVLTTERPVPIGVLLKLRAVWVLTELYDGGMNLLDPDEALLNPRRAGLFMAELTTHPRRIRDDLPLCKTRTSLRLRGVGGWS